MVETRNRIDDCLKTSPYSFNKEVDEVNKAPFEEEHF